MKRRLTFLTAILLSILTVPTFAQFKDQGFGLGAGFGATFSKIESRKSQDAFLARVFARIPFVNHLQGEIGVSLGKVVGSDFSTQIVPIDARLLISPLSLSSVNPYLYGGFGALRYDVQEVPANATPGVVTRKWTTYVPAGVGLQSALSDRVLFEISGGYNYTMTKDLDAVTGSKNDAFWNFLIGLTVGGESGSADPDGDGLTNAEERELKTNPKVADTDGDGLTDGEEVHKYHTDPLKADSDGDGLSDGDEVKIYHTDPNKADTDGDGLSDGDEVNKYHTDPLKADTDGDGLSDGDEVNKYHTDPLKADTDGDGLSDGDEVNKYHTDPLKADTDGGSVNDGIEVARGTDPLNPADDVPPKKEELKVEAGKAIILEGVVFKSGKSDVLPASEDILEKAFNTLQQNPEIAVEIRGYTDNVGKRANNVKLSLARAEAVKTFLVKKGVPAERITTKGLGPDSPIAPNTTPEGRQKNRRIEFFRTK